MSYLNINDISMNYHSKNEITEALKNINFVVNEGEFLSILGPSGCGKSTLLNIIAGLITPSSGNIFFNNLKIENSEDIFGYMFQKDHLFPWLTVYENIVLGLKIKKTLNNEAKDRVLSLINLYGLYDFKDYFPKQLSGGMKQRVALIRTLALEPKILLLDEPFSALDYQTRLKVCDEIFYIIKREKKTAIMVTHDISEAISTSSRVLMLSKRPATIKTSININFGNSDLSPLQRRDSTEFKDYFNLLWREID
ncbi:NitT/TauT family transport system ATP-binding protein [Clostridium cavendishii DSM 21758]|uniref:NitT/TauT family transport system ATP-binding protein n=1 Tax=Clostridium cavendishii DSM 21758 TaxID=1121302 RepID=A0A1M6NQC2_9CLOT|nr:ABC transporter ATP-binding protein [Clostridium cavendishii]SHJ97874.1 NitT/TauT family transport system ATP-binding protein [Clostridium cavendishii DSM 21758]